MQGEFEKMQRGANCNRARSGHFSITCIASPYSRSRETVIALAGTLGERQEHLQPGILRLKRLQLARVGYVHHTELRLPSRRPKGDLCTSERQRRLERPQRSRAGAARKSSAGPASGQRRDPSHNDRPRMIKLAFEGKKRWLAR